MTTRNPQMEADERRSRWLVGSGRSKQQREGGGGEGSKLISKKPGKKKRNDSSSTWWPEPEFPEVTD